MMHSTPAPTKPSPALTATLETAFAKHFKAIVGELTAMSALYDDFELPGDFLGNLYPFRQELDELIAEVDHSASSLEGR